MSMIPQSVVICAGPIDALAKRVFSFDSSSATKRNEARRRFSNIASHPPRRFGLFPICVAARLQEPVVSSTFAVNGTFVLGYFNMEVTQAALSHHTIEDVDPLDVAGIFGSIGGFWGESSQASSSRRACICSWVIDSLPED